MGPWFSQHDNQPVEALPSIDVGQITYREELAITGILVGAIVAALVVLRYGVSTGPGAALAYVGATTLGAMIGWWGRRIDRHGLAVSDWGGGSANGTRPIADDCWLQVEF